MSEQDLNSTMQEMMNEIVQLRAELNDIKTRVQILPQPTPQTKAEVSTTRRKMLRRLAGGLVAGLAVGAIGTSLPQEAEAKFVAAKGWGAVVVPPGGTIVGSTPSGTVYGLYATSDANTDIGNYSPNYKIAVVGLNTTTTSGNTYYGVFGQAKDAGVYGNSTSSVGNGVNAEATGEIGYGLYAKSHGTSGCGIYVEDLAKKADSYAGYFDGRVTVTGSLSKPAGSFKIDHPLDPANKYLYHSFVESPDMMNIYNGNVTLDNQGAASVTMPDWFDALNSDFRYQLTSLGAASPNLHIAEEMKEHKFKIAGGQPGQLVSWMVTGIRQDAYAKAHRIQVEEVKTDKEKGKYLHPELFGQPEEMSVHPRQVAAK